MDVLIFPIGGFLFCALVIIFAGTKLAFYGDALAGVTGMGKAWTGLIIMPAVTTLPELISSLSSVVIVNDADLAAGNVFGSCVFNLLILSFIDAQIKKPITSQVRKGHIVAGFFGLIMLGTTGLSIALGERVGGFWNISYFSPIILGIYLLAVRGIFLFEQKSDEPHPEPISDEMLLSSKIVVRRYLFYAAVVIVAALFLPYFGDSIVEQTGISQSFFGTFFLAITTSLPEFVVAISAIRLLAFDMLVGNLLGSNLYNILILAINDLAYRKGPLMVHIDKSHLISILFVIIMTAVVGLGLMVKAEKKYWKFGFDTLIVLVLYLFLTALLFFQQ